MLQEGFKLIQTSVHGDYYAHIQYDSDPSHPRTDWDNAATMACFHRRYNLGDKIDAKNFRSLLLSLDGVEYKESYDDLSEEDEIAKLYAQAEKHNVIMPVYLFDHSGISISTGSFNDPWDSGQVGIIYMSKKTILSEFGGKIVTAAKRAKAIERMQSEVKIYDDFLTNNVWGYTIYRTVKPIEEDQEEEIEIEDLEKEELDSCWGYFGDDEDGYMMNEIKAYVASDIKKLDSKPTETQLA